MNPRWSLLLITTLAILLASCASNIAKTPQDWPKAVIPKNDTCINLAGFYINRAIEAPTNKDTAFHERKPQWAVYLSKLLVPYIPSREFVEHKWADSIELSDVENGRFTIILKKNNKQIFKIILNEHTDFTCSSQGLVITGRSSPANMMGITERFETTTFTRGVDGSILVSEQEVDVGTAIVIPYVGKTIQRYRFLTMGSLE
jgi:hypothetical protein